MKKKMIMCCVAAALILSGCMSFSDLVPSAGGLNPLGAAQAKAEKRANAEIASGIGLTAMNRKMMFNMMYSQVYFIGGFGPGLYDMEEGQGAVWSMTSKDNDGTGDRIETERALLKNLADGSSWWYLGWRTAGGDDAEEWEFEALMDADMQALKIRYYNADVGRIQEAVFTPDGSAAAEDEETMEEPEEVPSSELETEDLSSLSRGREKIKVGAGTYTAEKIVWEFWDEESGESVTYTWWVEPSVPGGLVKYVFKGTESSVEGELESLKKGYKTKFGSY